MFNITQTEPLIHVASWKGYQILVFDKIMVYLSMATCDISHNCHHHKEGRLCLYYNTPSDYINLIAFHSIFIPKIPKFFW